MRQHCWISTLRLLTVLSGVYAVSCAAPQPITPPSTDALPTAHAARVEHAGLALQAAVLAKDQAQSLLGVPVAARAVLPVLFVLTNHTPTPYTVLREHFRLWANQGRYAPALPGRAATLLRDSSGSQSAAIAGWLVLGIFAAPGIDAAEKKESAAVVANQTSVFSRAEVPAAGTVAGYLFFEVPRALATVQTLTLELQAFADGTGDLLSASLTNPYAH